MNRKHDDRNSAGANTDDEKRAARQNNLILTQREKLAVSGVCDIVSFDENGVIMKTSLGVMSVDGNELHIVKLSLESGEVDIAGEINGIFYIDQNGNQKNQKSSGSFFKRK